MWWMLLNNICYLIFQTCPTFWHYSRTSNFSEFKGLSAWHELLKDTLQNVVANNNYFSPSSTSWSSVSTRMIFGLIFFRSCCTRPLNLGDLMVEQWLVSNPVLSTTKMSANQEGFIVVQVFQWKDWSRSFWTLVFKTCMEEKRFCSSNR